MRPSSPILALVAALATPEAVAQNAEASPPAEAHDGLRRMSLDAFGFGLYAPNGPGILGAGVRYSFAVHRFFDVDLAAAFLRAADASNLARYGGLVEGGVVTTGSLGVPQARIGAFASGGFAFLEGGPAVTGFFGLELRGGFAVGMRPTSGVDDRCGLDVRVRTGIRLFSALDGVDVLSPAYGLELAVGFGRGGPRPTGVGLDPWRQVARLNDAVRSPLRDLTGGSAAFTTCNATFPVAWGDVSAESEVGELRRCVMSDRSDLQAAVLDGCALYLTARSEEGGPRFELRAAGTPATSVAFDVTPGVSALLVCAPASADVRVSLEGRANTSDSARRALVSRVSVPWPAGVGVVEAAATGDGETLPIRASDTTRAWLVPSTDGRPPSRDRPWRSVVFEPTSNVAGRLCVYAPAEAELSVAFSTAAQSPADEDFHRARWDGAGTCSDTLQGATPPHLWLRQESVPAARDAWPIVVSVRRSAN